MDTQGNWREVRGAEAPPCPSSLDPWIPSLVYVIYATFYYRSIIHLSVIFSLVCWNNESSKHIIHEQTTELMVTNVVEAYAAFNRHIGLVFLYKCLNLLFICNLGLFHRRFSDVLSMVFDLCCSWHSS